MAALFRGIGHAAVDAQSLCVQAEGGRRGVASADRQRDRQSSRIRRWRAEGQGVFHRQFADRRRYPDELCRRNGQSVQQAWPVSQSRRLAHAHARAAGVPTFHREGRRLPLCEIGFRSMPRQKKMKRLLRLALLPLLMMAACTQQSMLDLPTAPTAPADRVTADRSHQSIGNISAHDFQPPPDPVIVDESVQPSSILPSKLGECADTTITSITDRFGADLTPSKKGADKGTFVRFSNSGVQVSLVKESAIVRSQVFDRVNM